MSGVRREFHPDFIFCILYNVLLTILVSPPFGAGAILAFAVERLSYGCGAALLCRVSYLRVRVVQYRGLNVAQGSTEAVILHLGGVASRITAAIEASVAPQARVPP